MIARRSRLAFAALFALACNTPTSASDTGVTPVDVADSRDAERDAMDDASDASESDDASDVVTDAPPPVRCVRRPRSDAGVADGGDAGLACNGSPELCERRFDQVAYATTHNAFAVEDERFGAPNQRRSMRQQLADGVRGLMLDVYLDRGRAQLCHGPCSLGRRPLVDGLCDITQFLDDQPGEVVTIIFESYTTAAEVERAFVESGLIERVHEQRAGDPWPTLRAMIERDRRVVVLTDREGGARPWYLPVWSHAWETPFSARTPTDLETCRMNRGSRANPLFIFNHFLTNPLASPELATMVNNDPFLIDRARRCQRETSALPNFVTVDYYDIGSVLSTTRALNGL
ncbi:MAG: hypothetical protein JNK05_33000 [Myxococcales bacterium]|nr:hypothetical protein [Myxococcales bacterium]